MQSKQELLLNELENLFLSDIDGFEKKLFFLSRNKSKSEMTLLKSFFVESDIGVMKLKSMLKSYWLLKDPYERHLLEVKICRIFHLNKTSFRFLLDELKNHLKSTV